MIGYVVLGTNDRALRLRDVQVVGRLGDLQLTIDTLGFTGLFADQDVAP